MKLPDHDDLIFFNIANCGANIQYHMHFLGVRAKAHFVSL
jgi:hypothetical protein